MDANAEGQKVRSGIGSTISQPAEIPSIQSDAHGRMRMKELCEYNDV